MLDTILATALIPFDATGDPLALFTTLALLSTFVYGCGYVIVWSRRVDPSRCRSPPRR